MKYLYAFRKFKNASENVIRLFNIVSDIDIPLIGLPHFIAQFVQILLELFISCFVFHPHIKGCILTNNFPIKFIAFGHGRYSAIITVMRNILVQIFFKNTFAVFVPFLIYYGI